MIFFTKDPTLKKKIFLRGVRGGRGKVRGLVLVEKLAGGGG